MDPKRQRGSLFLLHFENNPVKGSNWFHSQHRVCYCAAIMFRGRTNGHAVGRRRSMKRREQQEFRSERASPSRRQDLPQNVFTPGTTARIKVPTRKFAHTFVWNSNFWRTTAGNQARNQTGGRERRRSGKGSVRKGLGRSFNRIHLCQEVLATQQNKTP